MKTYKVYISLNTEIEAEDKDEAEYKAVWLLGEAPKMTIECIEKKD